MLKSKYLSSRTPIEIALFCSLRENEESEVNIFTIEIFVMTISKMSFMFKCEIIFEEILLSLFFPPYLIT